MVCNRVNSMKDYQRLIFVCTGNTCRSPMAQRIYQQLDDMKTIEVISRGLVVLFPEPANPKACTVMQNHDMDLVDHQSIALTENDIIDKTLILTMTNKQKEIVLEKFPLSTQVATLTEYVGQEGEVTDPYGGSLVDYEDCYLELSRLVKKLIYAMNEED